MDQSIDLSKTENKDIRFLTVKNTAEKLKRKAYLKFDLSAVKNQDINNVNLKLQLVPTGWGKVYYLPDKVSFTVYALTDENLDNWHENNINWKNAPANNQSAYKLNPDKVQKNWQFLI